MSKYIKTASYSEVLLAEHEEVEISRITEIEKLEVVIPRPVAQRDRPVVGFGKCLAIILGLLRAERRALKLETGEVGGGFLHTASLQQGSGSRDDFSGRVVRRVGCC